MQNGKNIQPNQLILGVRGMQTMYFRDGSYHEGMNLTVRPGKHWYSRLKPDDKVIFWKTGTKIDKRPIMEIQDVWFEYLRCSNHQSIIKELHHANYDCYRIKEELEKIKPNCTKEKVTLIFFLIEE